MIRRARADARGTDAHVARKIQSREAHPDNLMDSGGVGGILMAEL